MILSQKPPNMIHSNTIESSCASKVLLDSSHLKPHNEPDLQLHGSLYQFVTDVLRFDCAVLPQSFKYLKLKWLNPLKSTLPVQGYGGFYGELLLKLSQFLSERHRNYTPRNLEPFSFQIYTV